MPAIGAAKSVAASTTRIPSSGLVTDRPPAGSRCSASAAAAPASSSCSENSGGCGPPSTYHSEPSARNVGAALEDREARAAVRVLALGPVPDERLVALEQTRLGGELPLVLGRQPRAVRRGVRARLGERQSRHRLLAATAIAKRPARSRTLDLDEVVQARRQRLPLLDVRHLAVDARLAPAEDRARDGAGSTATNPSGTAATRRLGRVERAPSPAPGTSAEPPPKTSDARGRDGCEPERRQRERKAAPSERDVARRTARRHGSRAPTAPRRRRRQREATTLQVVAAGRERRPLAVRQQVDQRRCTSTHRRAAARLSRSFQPTHDAEDVLPDEHADAVQPRAVQLLGVTAVPAARVVEHVPLLEPARADHAGHVDCRRTTAPTTGGGLRSARAAASTRPRSAASGERRAQLGHRLLHRVEEDAVGAELAHELRDRRRVADRLAPRADVPRVVVDEHAHVRVLERRRRARGSRARRGTSRTGCARRCRSRDTRARARRRRSRRTPRAASASRRSGVNRCASWS